MPAVETASHRPHVHARSLPERCLDAADGDPWLALWIAVSFFDRYGTTSIQTAKAISDKDGNPLRPRDRLDALLEERDDGRGDSPPS